MRLTHLLMMSALASMASCVAPVSNESAESVSIAPQDFVLLPCGTGQTRHPCVLVAAGGKRILFGAPAGTAATLNAADLRQLDSVILFSLRAQDIEGLDEIRNESWRAGRDAPLLTIGPRGVLAVVGGLNTAFEQADALRIVEEGIPAGGYDAAILTGREATREQIVFDTGDVQVERLAGGYRITYEGGALADLIPCEADSPALAEQTVLHVTVSCDGPEPGLVWPLREPYFVVRQAPGK